MILAVGCSSASKAPPTSQVAPPAPAEVVTIKLAVPEGTTEMMSEFLLPAFEAKYEHYKVEQVTYRKSDELQELAQLGKADVIVMSWVNRPDLPRYAQPLDAYLTRSKLDTAPYGNLVDELRVGGRTYDLPYSVGLGLLLYDVDAVRAAGVAIPAGAWTWDEFRAAVGKLTQGTGDQKVWGLETIFHEDLFQLWLEGKTSKPFGEADLATLREGIGFFHTMVYTDQSMVPAPAYNISPGGIGFSYSRIRHDALVNGKAVMIFEEGVDAWDFSLLGRRLNWDVAPMPAAPGARPILPVYPRTMGIATGSVQPDAAWEFIAFSTGPEGAAMLARGGHPPAYLSDATRQAWEEHRPAYPPGLKSIWAATWKSNMGMTASGGQSGHRLTEVRKAQNWALSGRKSIDDALGWFVANEGGK
jgi:multiple sugar transport system substrate-binding protein